MEQKNRLIQNYPALIKVLITVLAFGAMTLAVMCVSSCNTAKRDTARLARIEYRSPEVVEAYCARNFKGGDSVAIVKEYIQGEEVVKYDTLFAEQEVLVLEDTTVITRTIVKTVRVTDTLRDTKYVQVENKARVALLEREKKQLNDTLIVVTDSRNDWRQAGLIFGGLLLLLIIYKIWKLCR